VANRHHFPLAAAAALPPTPGSLAADIFAHGSLSLEFYAPRRVDTQHAHTRDELYVIASGSGWFVNGDARHRFVAGDTLFVAAGIEHRFEDFSDDFGTWVMFYGPEGGEKKS
jgi:mannose-6-phosphate isomerase-like protein (cupin superfamily)